MPVAVHADVPDDWAKPYIDRGISLSIIPKELQSDYPKAISRLDFCIALMNLLEAATGKNVENLVDIPLNAFKDIDNKYASAAYALKIVSGTGNGNFSPHNSLTRQEAAVMITNAARALGARHEAAKRNYADGFLIAGWASGAVDFVSHANIMSGVGSNLFEPTGLFTRQQTYVAMMRAYDYFADAIGTTISEVSVLVGDKAVNLGMSLDMVTKTFGTPTERLESVHDHTWYVYADDYENFIIIGIRNKDGTRTVAAIATNAKNFKYGDVTANRYDYDKATKAYPNAAFFKDMLSSPGKTFVDGVLIYGSDFFYSSSDFEGKKDIYLKTLAKETFYFTNGFRVKRGLKPCEYSEAAEKAAVSHSADQAVMGLMTHTGSDGSSAPTRLTNTGIQWKAYAENVAYGQYNGIFAFESWLNSENHRNNMLGGCTYMGCGTALSSSNAIYYTQNYFTPLYE